MEAQMEREGEYGPPRLPAMPLARALRRVLDRRLAMGILQEEACGSLGVCSKSVREWTAGNIRYVDFDQADEILSRTEFLWWDVWEEPVPPPACGTPDLKAWFREAEDYMRVLVAFDGDRDAAEYLGIQLPVYDDELMVMA
jgi:hypothetical protein